MATTKARRERLVENRIKERAREHKGTAYKFTSPGRRSVPDDLIDCPCIPHELRTLFIEAKAPGKKPTPAQTREHIRLRSRGNVVFVADDYWIVDLIFESVCDGSCNAVDA
jgi:hypothetical protein